jgi:hypothetical protein
VYTFNPRVTGKSVEPPEWSLMVQGACTEVVKRQKGLSVCPGRTRGIVNGLSRQSRMRLLRLNCRVNWFACFPCLFATLTYPDTHLVDRPKERSLHRFLFHRRLESYLGRKISCLWRIEWKPRLSGIFEGYLEAHLHLILPTVPRIPWQDFRGMWNKSIGHEGYVHTWLRQCDTPEGVAKYLSKYVAKFDSLVYRTYRNNAVTPGRAWGVLRPQLLPKHPLRLYRGMTGTEVEFVRAMRRQFGGDECFEWQGGFTIFGKDVADQIADVFNIDLVPSTKRA